MTEVARSANQHERAVELAQLALACDPTNEPGPSKFDARVYGPWERGAAIRQFEIYRSYLWAEPGLEPAPETVALYRWIQQETLPNLRDLSPIHNLPRPLTSFVGRSAEIAQVRQLLEDFRLVTLAGIGGGGSRRDWPFKSLMSCIRRRFFEMASGG